MFQATPVVWKSCADMRLLKKKLWARCVLECSNKRVFTREEFIALCTSNPYTPSTECMTVDEARKYLQTLHLSHQVVLLQGRVYTNPCDVVNAVHVSAGLSTLPRGIPAHLRRHDDHDSQICTPTRGVEKRCRRNFWALVSLFSGLQMAVLAYLTFLVYSWDVMEPVCYFVTTLSSLCVYAYSLLVRREFSYADVEKQVLQMRSPLRVFLPSREMQTRSHASVTCRTGGDLYPSLDAAELLQSIKTAAADAKEEKVNKGEKSG